MNERRAQRVRIRNGEAGDIERCRQWVDVEVRYSDLDAQARVNNAIFFTYFEQARVAFLAETRGRGLEHLRQEEGGEVASSSSVSSPVMGDRQRTPAGATGVESGSRIEAADIPYVIASASCVYSKPITSLAPIEIGVYCSELGRVSFELRYVVCDKGRRTVYATGTTLIVNVDVETGRPRM
ncbi:MAG TPA: acyl-CoA thioesterase, partial [Ktedonobacterales bacterium]